MRPCVVYLTQLRHSSYARSASQIGSGASTTRDSASSPAAATSRAQGEEVPSAASVAAATKERRHNWLRHQCERLSSLPATDNSDAERLSVAARAGKKPRQKAMQKAQRREYRVVHRGVVGHKNGLPL